MGVSNNDNELGRLDLGKVDPHGHAALLLVESLILSLVDKSVICTQEAQHSVSFAMDATEEVAGKLAVRHSLQRSVSLLSDIRHSLASAS